MTENCQSTVLTLVKQVRGLSVDKNLEKKVFSLLSQSLPKDINSLEHLIVNDDTSSSSSERNLTTKMIFDKLHFLPVVFDGNSPRLLKDLFKNIPTLHFIFTFVADFFHYIENQESWPIEVKTLILKLQLPLLKTAILQPKMLIDPIHPAFLLINEIKDYSRFWQHENEIGHPTFTKISQSLQIDDQSYKDINSYFLNAFNQMISIKNTQNKRASIFEKRLKETELSKEKLETAIEIATNVCSKISQSIELPDVLIKLFNGPWKNLLQLEYVRDDEVAFEKAIKDACRIILSVQPIQDKESLDKLFVQLPNINKALKKAFQKISYSDKRTLQFLSEIEAIHISLIKDSEQSINKAGEEGILRLKPVDVFLNAELSTDEDVAVVKETNDKNNQILTVFSKLNKTIKQLNDEYHLLKFNSNEDCIQLQENYSIKENQYFRININDEFSLHKLIAILDNINHYIFVNLNGELSHKLSVEELLKMLNNQAILPLDKYHCYKEYCEKNIFKLTQISKDICKTFQQKEIKEIKIQTDNNKSKITVKIDSKNTLVNSASNENNDNLVTANTIKTTPKNLHSKLDTSTINVGTWLEISIDNIKKRCKLAAKIASKSTYIFVDRQGKKIFELTEGELSNMIEQQQIEIMNAVNEDSNSLEAIISTNRNMKNS